MTKEKIRELLVETNVIQEGHFVLSSGRHADIYMQCAKVLQYPEHASTLAAEIAKKWTDEEIDVVIGPALGGVVLSYAVAEELGVRSIFSERKSGEMKIRRGFELEVGEKVLVVEDVVTTGGSVKEVLAVLEELDVEIVGLSSIVDRSNGEVGFNYDFKPLLPVDIKSYKAGQCELCQQGMPITRPGSKEK
ncbi:orotate phosphoribosyltransferase [Halanaerobium saccharolyticum]|uniref:Orotate phosphoribosyltransferase n=1 Tax=Halanaerobium saccharolyticum TaxID=43595 RepID=A0A4R7Z5X1_9FIRM|nr:orotate phosphoribosyltransferase [Halanaerobium saccharolyticum]RAK10529.1 orotate phosphoribosyltransferase [Halanaerobium saccharolyticum]TDW06714.1 orotate phosphoribosyltransferase [Halanaerobium saccharolyticum]TDX62349.1 orotate phosphoribosyltransferase [Halanaerobium saccharolyticum]